MTRLFLTLFVALAIAVSYSMAHAQDGKPIAPPVQRRNGNPTQVNATIKQVPPPNHDTETDTAGKVVTTTENSSGQELEERVPVKVNDKTMMALIKLKEKRDAKTGAFVYDASAEVIGCEQCRKIKSTGKLEDIIVGPGATANLIGIPAILDAYAEQSGYAPKTSTTATPDAVASTTDEEKKKKEITAAALKKAKDKVELCEIMSFSGDPIVEKRFNDREDPSARIECYGKAFRALDNSTDKESVVMAKLKKIQKKLKDAYLRFMDKDEQDETLAAAFDATLDDMEDSKFDSISAEAAHIRAIALSNRQTKLHNQEVALKDKFIDDRNHGDTAAMAKDLEDYKAKLADFQQATSDLAVAGHDYRSALANNGPAFPGDKQTSIAHFSDPADDNINRITSNPNATIMAANDGLTKMQQQLTTASRNQRTNRNGVAGNSLSGIDNDFTSGLTSIQNSTYQNGRTISQNGVTFNRGLDIQPRGTPTATYSATPPIINLFPGGSTNWQQSRTPGTGALAMSTIPSANLGQNNSQFANGAQNNSLLFPPSQQSNGANILQGRGMAVPRG